MPPLQNARHERFAQLLAAGMGQSEAYEQAGYKPHSGNAATLRADKSVSERVASLLAAGSRDTEKAVTAKQRFIARAWEKVAASVELMTPEDMADIKALVESALNAEKDQRVVDGGVSDRTERDTVVEDRRAQAKAKVDEVFARLAPANAA